MRIKLYDHPFAACAPQVFEAASIGQWLLDYYGDVPSVKVQVFRGEPCADNEITGNMAALLANDCDEYVILQSPGGVDPFSWALIAIAAVMAVATIILMPKPVMPGNVNRTQQSPNNSLANRENKVRLLERVEDIYGTVMAIPSLLMPTYTKYINHRKYEYGYYCVGRGYHALAELRDGDTLIADIEGASAAVYDPFTSPNSGHAPILQIGDTIIDDVLTVSRAIEVDGITLKAFNQVQLPESGQYTFTPNVGGDVITQTARTPNFNAITNVGDSITVVMDDYVVMTDPGSPAGVGGVPPAVPPTYATYNYSGTYTIAAVSDGAVTLTTATWAVVIPDAETADAGDPPVPVTTPRYSELSVAGKTNYTAWVTLPDTDRTEVWVNMVAPNGLFKDNGGKSVAAVAFDVEIEKLDANLVPLGIVETASGSLSGSVNDERADTLEHATAWTGPARVRMRRTTAYDYGWNGTVMDEIKWADLYSVSPVSKTEFGNKTTIHTITQATSRATAVKSRQLNCIASRKLPTYNGTAFSGAFNADGLLVSGTIAATSKIVDIIAAVSMDPKIGARDLATEVDLAQIWGVQQKLDAWNAASGQFNYTFDTDNTSFEETIIAVANAGFCIAYRQNGKIRLALDQAHANSAALFTHRNKKPSSETITRKFASDAEYDGVEFVYVDPESNQSETITLPLDGNYTKLKKFEIAGVRSFTQAWLRANREYQKLIGQRITIETVTTLDARALLPNARIDVVDSTRFKSYDGEVVAQNGLELTLSRNVEFEPNLPHSIVLMKRDGSLQSIPVTPGSSANKVILRNLPGESIVTSYGESGIRTIYSFAADSARGAMAYLVQELDISDGQYATIRAINYSGDYYQADSAPIPDKKFIIN